MCIFTFVNYSNNNNNLINSMKTIFMHHAKL